MPKNYPFNEKQLMSLIAAGDQYAFQKLYDHYRNRIYGVAYKLIRSKVVANEIVANVFLTIWLRRKNLLDVHNFSAYLFTVTRNDAYKALKKMARDYKLAEIEYDQTHAHNDTEEYLINKEYRGILDGAVNRLPKQQKVIFKLIKEEGLKREEVANLLNISPETVKFHLAKAVKRVRFFCRQYIDLFNGILLFLLSSLDIWNKY